jgi:glycosyltransferase involved in cell wall biosynthesis
LRHYQISNEILSCAVEEKKVLIITYYWPPSGGSGVQRWLKFVKYLPQYGYTPYVFTPENPSFDIKDPSLAKDVPEEAEVIHFPIWEPYEAFFRLSRILTGKRKKVTPTQMVSGQQKSWFQRMATWVRGNLIIPDPRVFWVKPSAKFLHEFLAENKIRTIITTGPPHSIHLIGLRLKKKNPGLKWIADFRDPWSEWGFLDSLGAGQLAKKQHRRREAEVLAHADEIITITPFYVRQFERLSGRKVKLLNNGFDEDDFREVRFTRTDKFIIRHVGIVNEKCDPRPFLDVVRSLANELPEFREAVRIEFIGEVHPRILNFVADSDVLKTMTKFYGNIPFRELITLYGSSSLLLLVLTGYKDAEGYMPGKLFEYMAVGLPILGVGPVNGDAADLLREAKAGEMVDSFDQANIRDTLLKFFEAWRSDPSYGAVRSPALPTYSRRAITGKLVNMLS